MLDVIAPRWSPTGAWAGIVAPGRGGSEDGAAGVRIELVEAMHVVAIAARPVCRAELARIVAESLGAPLPSPGRITDGRAGAVLVWSGQDHWLAFTRAAMPATLRADLARVAAVTDQSSARALLRVSGRDAREALGKGFAIDLHPDAFTPGSTAATSVAHIGVQIWQRDEGAYTIAVPRSFASSFWSWLVQAAAPHGWEVTA